MRRESLRLCIASAIAANTIDDYRSLDPDQPHCKTFHAHDRSALATGATVAAHFAPPNHFRDRISLTIEIGDLRFSSLRGAILIKIHVRELLRVAKAEPRMMNTLSFCKQLRSPDRPCLGRNTSGQPGKMIG
jgi:hypothetical protein